MGKKILILGAGNAQIDLINYCNSIGLETYGCSYTNTDKGIPLLKYFEQINIIDAESIKNYFIKNEIDYIYSVGSDIAMPTVSRVAEETSRFCFVSSQTADICCNKHLMRKALGESPYNLPYTVCSTLEQALKADFFPYMLKPVDSQGQRGVYLIDNKENLKSLFENSLSYSKSGKVILEKHISGDEVSVNAYVKDGKVIFSIISDRESFKNLPGGIIKAHHLPSVYENTPIAEKINDLVAQTVKKLQIKNGPVYFQIIVSENNPYLIEVTPRLDGCHMWNLINRYCGVNLFELTMKQFFGEKICIGDYKKSKYPMHLEFFCEPPEAVFDENKYNKYFSDYTVMYYRTGDKVRKLNGYMEKCGYRIYKSPNRIGLIGGSGFVGSNFSKMYSDEFDIVDISRKNGAVTDYTTQQLEKKLAGCDSVVILAGKKVNQAEKQSISLYFDNISVVENILEACKKLGIKNIVFASSRCVYANNQPVPIAENGVIEPINHYGISKLAAEHLCAYYNQEFGMNIKILRFAQIIGNDKNGYMIDKFVSNAVLGEPLTVYGKAIGRRDYIYINDVCRAIYLSLKRCGKIGIYNIALGCGTSSKELAQAVINGFDSDSKIILLADKPEDTAVTFFDVSKAEKELGFSCEYSVEKAFKDLSKRCDTNENTF